jgi:hypothetical protein
MMVGSLLGTAREGSFLGNSSTARIRIKVSDV